MNLPLNMKSISLFREKNGKSQEIGKLHLVPSSNWLGGHPFKVEIGVRAPVG